MSDIQTDLPPLYLPDRAAPHEPRDFLGRPLDTCASAASASTSAPITLADCPYGTQRTAYFAALSRRIVAIGGGEAGDVPTAPLSLTAVKDLSVTIPGKGLTAVKSKSNPVQELGYKTMAINTRGKVTIDSEFHPAGAERKELAEPDIRCVSIVSVGNAWNKSQVKNGYALYRRSGGHALEFDTTEYIVTEMLSRIPTGQHDKVQVNWVVRYRSIYRGQRLGLDGSQALEIVSITDCGAFDPARDNDYEEVRDVGQPTVADPLDLTASPLTEGSRARGKPTSDKLNDVFPRDADGKPAEDKPARRFNEFFAWYTPECDRRGVPEDRRTPIRREVAGEVTEGTTEHFSELPEYITNDELIRQARRILKARYLQRPTKDQWSGWIADHSYSANYVLSVLHANSMARGDGPVTKLSEWDGELEDVLPIIAQHQTNAETTPSKSATASGAQTEPTAQSEPSKPAGDETTRSETGNVSAIGKPEPGKVDACTGAASTSVVTGEIVVYDAQRAIERMMQRSDIMTGIRNAGILKAGIDYGVIPGTESKDPDRPSKQTLLKPGAEKLCSAFGLCPEFRSVDKVTSWSPNEPLFYYQYECRLVDITTGKTVATGIGSCNSMESKYRWRNANRTCPKCSKEIRKSKDKPEFYCWTKTGGCGATFGEKDPAITSQTLGKVPNDDVFSLVNTIDKMAQKRALIAATLIGTNASDHFTQDIEDIPQFGYIDIEAA